MGHPTVQSLLVVALCLTATLYAGPTLVHAEGVPVEATFTTNTTNMTGVGNQCSLQRRQDLLDARLNTIDTRLSTQVNNVDTRLNTQQSDVNSRLNDINTRLNTQQNDANTDFNRIDGRFDELETAMSDIKEHLQTQMEAMGQKVEWALAAGNPHRQKESGQGLPGTVTPNPTRVSRVHQDCQGHLAAGSTTSGVYSISPDNLTTVKVYCEQTVGGGGWTVFQSRKDSSVDFFRDWNNYKAGFGNLTGEFWLGNTIIHQLTKRHEQELRIELTSPDGEVKYASYSNFWIEDEQNKFRIGVSGYSGGTPPGDSLSRHNECKFTTKDQDNDEHVNNCAHRFMGAWWYHPYCGYSNLNGVHGSTARGKGINWIAWKGFEVSMKATRMMIRRKP